MRNCISSSLNQRDTCSESDADSCWRESGLLICAWTNACKLPKARWKIHIIIAFWELSGCFLLRMFCLNPSFLFHVRYACMFDWYHIALILWETRVHNILMIIAYHDVLYLSITLTSQWARRRPKSPASWLFTQQFIQAQIKENIKAPCHWPLCGEFTGDQWIPRTKGQ